LVNAIINRKNDDEYFTNDFLEMIVGKLGTCFATPEESVIKQGEDGFDMFFISKGDCAVNITDEKGMEHIAVSLLVTGDHFGEVSLVYKCKRTATVISRNYNTMARLTYHKYREVINEYPQYLSYLKKHLNNYIDQKKMFMKKLISKVFYFREGLTTENFHDIIYQLKPKIYEMGQIIIK